MTPALSALDRIVVFLTGLLLVALGIVPAALYWRIPYLSPWLLGLDRSRLAAAPGESWYPAAVIALLVALVLLGLWFILANIRNRAFSNRAVTPADPGRGETVINVQRVAEAACAEMEASPLVVKATSSVAVVGRRPSATFTVTANPDVPLADVAHLIEGSDSDFAAACPGVDIDTVYMMHLERISG